MSRKVNERGHSKYKTGYYLDKNGQSHYYSSSYELERS